MGATAQIANIMFSDDHKPHLDRPFSIIIGKREFTPRSVVGDIMHLIEDPRSFAYYRINPVWGRPLLEAALGRDRLGRKVGVIDAAKDILSTWVPIPMQQPLKKELPGENLFNRVINSVLASVGVSNYPYRTRFEKYSLENKPRMDVRPTERTKLKYDLEEELREKKPEAKEDLRKARLEKRITLKEESEIKKKAKEPDTLKTAEWMDVNALAKGIKLYATDDEKKTLKPLFLKKLKNAKDKLDPDTYRRYREIWRDMP
jgi:hypothetical protein